MYFQQSYIYEFNIKTNAYCQIQKVGIFIYLKLGSFSFFLET